MDDPRYPIGPFSFQGPLDERERRECIARIAAAPERLRAAVDGLTEAQLATPYRDGGWTVRQVVHHVPDSHLNAYTRFRLTLTEPTPTIRPYFEDRWAELPDAREAPIAISLDLLAALHRRWVALLEQIPPVQWKARLVHPEMGRELVLEELLALYAWHGEHHTAHVTALRRRRGW
jgi:uncharacterized damage-inducible protein DinB